MDINNYIKVTLPGESTGRVILATLRTFYISQGASVEQPTEDEIKAAFPGEFQQAEQVSNDADVARYKAEIAKLYETAAKQDKDISALKDANAKLQEKLNASETALAETEKLVENLKKQIKEASQKATPKE